MDKPSCYIDDQDLQRFDELVKNAGQKTEHRRWATCHLLLIASRMQGFSLI
jgi:hypothetical protein